MHSVNDLRSALELLRAMPGQLVETDVEVDPAAELSGVYRYVGAGGTVQRPTKVNGPAMLFHNIKGHPDAQVAIGVDPAVALIAFEAMVIAYFVSVVNRRPFSQDQHRNLFCGINAGGEAESQ